MEYKNLNLFFRYEKTVAEYITKLPKGKNSCKGLGRTIPDPAQSHLTADGVEIPIGKQTESGVKDSTLLYNE
jgi:hypothetical protein